MICDCEENSEGKNGEKVVFEGWHRERCAAMPLIKRKLHIPKDFTIYRQEEENKPITTGRVKSAIFKLITVLENLGEIGDFASIESAKPIPVTISERSGTDVKEIVREVGASL